MPSTRISRQGARIASLALAGTILTSALISSAPTASAASTTTHANAHLSGSTYPGTVYYSDLYNASITQTLVDSAGDLYVFGSEGSRAFVRKVNPSTSQVYFTNYFGPNGSTVVAATFDPAGYIYITGKTPNSMIAVSHMTGISHVFDTDYNAYVAKLNPTTGRLEYATGIYFTPIDIVADAQGNAYLLGDDAQLRGMNRAGLNTGPHGSTEAYVFKLDPSGATMSFSTYIGGTSVELGKALALVNNELYVAGITKSNDMPTSQWGYHNSQDGFLISLDTTNGGIIWSTYLGGSNYDAIQDMAYMDGTIYIAGDSDDGLFGTFTFDYQPTYIASSDGFVMAMRTDTRQFFFNGFVGLLQTETGISRNPKVSNMKLAPQTDGTVFITGMVNISDIFADATGGVFVSKISPATNTMSAALAFANNTAYSDKPTSLVTDSNNNFYISGLVGNTTTAGITGTPVCGKYCTSSTMNSYVQKVDGSNMQ